jgi:hypothetical protein
MRALIFGEVAPFRQISSVAALSSPGGDVVKPAFCDGFGQLGSQLRASPAGRRIASKVIEQLYGFT